MAVLVLYNKCFHLNVLKSVQSKIIWLPPPPPPPPPPPLLQIKEIIVVVFFNSCSFFKNKIKYQVSFFSKASIFFKVMRSLCHIPQTSHRWLTFTRTKFTSVPTAQCVHLKYSLQDTHKLNSRILFFVAAYVFCSHVPSLLDGQFLFPFATAGASGRTSSCQVLLSRKTSCGDCLPLDIFPVTVLAGPRRQMFVTAVIIKS